MRPPATLFAAAILAAMTTGCSTKVKVTAEPNAPARVTAAEQLQRCMAAHDLRAPSEKKQATTNLVAFQLCRWPPGPGADQTGYSEIDVATRPGPGTNEASDSDVADYINATCQVIELGYTFGVQGTFEHLRPFRVSAGIVTSEDAPGQPWTGAAPYPYPDRNQVVYLHNSNQVVDTARCLS